MRVKMSKRKTIARVLSVVLVAVVLFNAVTYPDVQAAPTDPVPTTQTGYANLISYQAEKWNNILKDIFKEGTDDGSIVSVGKISIPDGATAATSGNIPIPSSDNIINNKIQVKDDATYFNWKKDLDTSIEPWSGIEGEDDIVTPETESITYAADSVANGANGNTINADAVTVEYTVYNVSTADELFYAMKQAKSAAANVNVKINLQNDIDLNGQNQTWLSQYVEPDYAENSWFYIEGNGYTIYNMKVTSYTNASNRGTASFLGTLGNHSDSSSYDYGVKKKVVLKNLNFSNCLIFSTQSCTSVVVSFNRGQLHMENVNVKDSFVYSNMPQTGTLMGRQQSATGDTFLRNCSSQSCYVFGTDHSGGLTGCQHNVGYNNYKVKYNVEFPASPEVWMAKHKNGYTSEATFPEMVETCYSVDSELYSLGSDGDSGGLLSCGGKLICRNSFTNNIVYGNTRTGAFFGRIVTPESRPYGLYDDAGNRLVEIYFENCYAAGSIEGKSKIGGFVGFEAGAGSGTGYGISVYKNCYTTAMVGMDYAGNQLGGFVGHENTKSNQKATIIIGTEDGESITNSNAGSVYLSCYAAGEVGNILTDTSTTQSGTYNRLGGFLGEAGNYGTRGESSYTSGKGNGTYVNCYYDMQTTAMRERACGRPDQFTDRSDYTECANSDMESQIPGVTGVYTQHSDKKDIQGLTDTVNMGNDDVWTYATDMYPALKSLSDEGEVTENFGTLNGADQQSTVTAAAQTEEVEAVDGESTTDNMYDDATVNRINAQLAKKVELVKKYSQASVSTVMLSHWDSTMNMDTGTLDGETSWMVGLPQNKLTQKTYAQDDKNKWAQDKDGMYWEIAYKNLAAGEYPFKVQAGTSWAYNFGSNKFNGDNCSLTVEQDCDVKIKFDYVEPASETGENTNFIIWAEFYEQGLYDEGGNEKADAVVTNTIVLGKNAKADQQNLWTVVGSFQDVDADANWNPTYSLFDMSYVGTGQGNGDYELRTTLPAGTYQFKIARDHDWGESYGASGGEGNMEMIISKECQVVFTFNENTHKTEVTATPADALVSAKTEKDEIIFTGYSLIAPTAITGHEWLDGLEAAEDGEMTDAESDGIYEVSFTVTGEEKFDKIYGYKVIENAKDEGPNNYFRLDKPTNGNYSVTLTFTYNPLTGEAHVICVEDLALIDENPYVDHYGVLGSEKLTGLNWGKDENDQEVSDAGYMQVNNEGKYYITYNDVEPGTHSFKVVANSSFSSGIDYGAYDGNNYQFTTNETANITITFDADTKRITVTSNPESAIEKTRYVISGNQALTKESWNVSSTANEMEYDDDYTGVYSKSYENLTSGQNYAFKVVEFGVDDKAYPQSFQIAGAEGETYELKIIYSKKYARTEYYLYDSQGNDVTDECLVDAVINSWSVIGDASLTGYNWLGENNSQQVEAAEKGLMSMDDNGKLSVTFSGVKVTENIQSMGFKVVAEGTWDTGISYGTKSGENYTISLASQTVSECSVTIAFDPDTHDISVSTNPEECLVEDSIDESSLEWFIAGDYRLVSEDAYNTPATVYDTVRDITYAFKFTSGSGLIWSYSEARNTDSSFFTYMGEEEEGFSLEYTVEDKEINGIFKEKVITLDAKEDSASGYTQYSCSRFMPGKQWLAITTNGGTNNIIGNRNIRLIPTAYLEAGNEADIYVLQSNSDSKLENVSNVVTYRKNSLAEEGITFTGLEDGAGNNTIFNRYNFALTTGYAITDRTGLGYYGNYSQQKIQSYSKDSLRANKLDENLSETYFAMSSVFNQNEKYIDTAVAEGETSNLVVDELVDQSLIGSSYNDGTSGAKTIVKIYKKVEDENGTLESDGKKYSYPKVFMEKTTSAADGNNQSKNAYQKNYLKWTGQMPFDASDEGTYFVTYFWSLSDGRFLTDSKKVYIYSDLSSIEKMVDKSYVEKEETIDGETLTYTVTYTNKVEGDFTICDVLPFDGDVRTDTSKKDGVSSSIVGGNTQFTLKSIRVDSSVTAETEGDAEPVVSVSDTQYTDDLDVRKYTYTTDSGEIIPAEQVAEKINNAADIEWNSWNNSSVPNATAFRINGKQTGEGTSTITVTYEVEVKNAQKADYYVNNAFFTVTNTVSGNTIDGYSTPVATAVVGRELSGYVWVDSDVDGKFDDAEPAIQGVIVTLMKKVVDSYTGMESYVSTERTAITDQNGYYEFKDIYPSGDYRIQFSADSEVTVTNSVLDSTKEDKVVSFDSLNLSRRLSPYQVTEKSSSRNIAKAVSEEDTDKQYAIDDSLPSAENIYKNNNQPRYQTGSVTNYYFTRLYQNLGLTEISEEKKSSLTIKKVDADDGTPLEGVKFKLEYRLDDTEEYKAVTYKVEDDKYIFIDTDEVQPEGTIISQDAVATDANGRIQFTELPVADYRLTEVETKGGYNLLAEKLEFGLPYVIRGTSNKDGYVTGNEDNKVESTLEKDVTYYYDVTYTVTNSRLPNMPSTGVNNNYIPIIIAAVLFISGFALYGIYSVRKNKKNRIK